MVFSTLPGMSLFANSSANSITRVLPTQNNTLLFEEHLPLDMTVNTEFTVGQHPGRQIQYWQQGTSLQLRATQTIEAGDMFHVELDGAAWYFRQEARTTTVGAGTWGWNAGTAVTAPAAVPGFTFTIATTYGALPFGVPTIGAGETAATMAVIANQLTGLMTFPAAALAPVTTAINTWTPQIAPAPAAGLEWFDVTATAEEVVKALVLATATWDWDFTAAALPGDPVTFDVTVPAGAVTATATHFEALYTPGGVVGLTLPAVQEPGLPSTTLNAWPNPANRDTFIFVHPDFPATLTGRDGGYVVNLGGTGAAANIVYTRVAGANSPSGFPAGTRLYTMSIVGGNATARATVTLLQNFQRDDTIVIPLVTRTTTDGDVRVRVERGTSQVQAGTWTIASPRPLEITSPNTLTKVEGVRGSLNLTTRGGGTPVSFTLSGAPAGLAIIRYPTMITYSLSIPPILTAGTYTFTITARDNAGAEYVQNFTLIVEPAQSPRIITPPSLTIPEGMSGAATLSVIGAAPIILTLSGAPIGVTVAEHRLLIDRGTAPGSHTFTITASNHIGPDYVQNFTLNIMPAPPAPKITSVANLFMPDGTGSSMELTATGVAPINFALSGAPEGVVIADGRLHIAFTVPAGTYTFTITASNNFGYYVQNFTLTIEPSTNAYLYHLSTSHGTLLPAFSPIVLNYTVNVANDVTAIYIRAIAMLGATVSGAGSHNLNVGQNTITLTVTASAGNTQTYTIVVTRAAAADGGIGGGNIGGGGGAWIPAARVTAVNVAPAAATVAREQSHRFTATVVGTNNPSQRVTWSVEGNTSSATTISANGLLNIVGDETAATLTIRATSTANSAISGTATVTVSGAVQESLPVPEAITTLEPLPFTDVAAASWYYDSVRTVWENSIFQGTAHDRFSPNIGMTRAMFVQVIANLEGVDLLAYSDIAATFNDVSASAWYFAAVEWAVRQGIVRGVGDGNFAPNAPVTREQMAVMLHNYIDFAEITLPFSEIIGFADQNDISYWAYDAISAMKAAGIITGRPDGRFDPQTTATRAEAAAIFARLLGIIE